MCKIYHIIHISKLPAILAERNLISDAEVRRREPAGVTIGMSKIKQRRLEERMLLSHPGLYVGECVPFYFCPRSIMLYMFHMGNHPDIEYRGGQEPIVHLVADMEKAVEWANINRMRWAFTTSNAGSGYCEDFSDLNDLGKIDWDAVNATNWANCKDRKQAEFLVEQRFPWKLIEKIGVYSFKQFNEVSSLLSEESSSPQISIERSWYY